MRNIFLINETAGKGLAAKLPAKIEAAARRLGAEYSLHTTLRAGDARSFTRACCESAGGETLHFFACGGDGTLSEVMDGARGFANAAVGVVPLGTGNDFVRAFSEPAAFLDIDAQLAGSPYVIDLLESEGRTAVNVVNAGFDAAVAEVAAKVKRYPLLSGSGAYFAGVAVTLTKPCGARLTIQLDDEPPFTIDCMMIAVGNACCYGGGFRALPYASLTDGRLDVGIIRSAPLYRLVPLMLPYRKGVHLESDRGRRLADYRRAQRVRLSSPSELVVSFDGEITRRSALELTLLPAAGRLLLPQGVSPRVFPLPEFLQGGRICV